MVELDGFEPTCWKACRAIYYHSLFWGTSHKQENKQKNARKLCVIRILLGTGFKGLMSSVLIKWSYEYLQNSSLIRWWAGNRAHPLGEALRSSMEKSNYAATAAPEKAFLKEASPPAILFFPVMDDCVDYGSHRHLPDSMTSQANSPSRNQD